MYKPILLFLGMHRSGTSFLARSFNLCGVNLGALQSLVSNEWINKSDNLKGHWENLRLVNLADRVLEQSNGSWYDPPEKIEVENKITDEIKQEIDSLMAGSTLLSGIKDPRLILCLDSWIDLLPNNFIVIGIFRNPISVAESLKIRNKFSEEKSFNLWKMYNEKLLQILEKYNGFLLNFDWSKERLFSEINLICEKLGIPQIDLSQWYTIELIHHKDLQNNSELPEHISKIYSKLIDRSENNSTVEVPCVFSKQESKIMKDFLLQINNQKNYFTKIYEEVKNENSLLKNSIKIKDEQLGKLEVAVNQKDEQLGKLEVAVNQKDEQLGDEQLGKLEVAVNQKDEQLGKLEVAVNEYENSTTWKILRKYDSFKIKFKKTR
jgi:hypothetical protein